MPTWLERGLGAALLLDTAALHESLCMSRVCLCSCRAAPANRLLTIQARAAACPSSLLARASWRTQFSSAGVTRIVTSCAACACLLYCLAFLLQCELSLRRPLRSRLFCVPRGLFVHSGCATQFATFVVNGIAAYRAGVSRLVSALRAAATTVRPLRRPRSFLIVPRPDTRRDRSLQPRRGPPGGKR